MEQESVSCSAFLFQEILVALEASDYYITSILTLQGKYDEKELKDALLANTEKFLKEAIIC